MLSTDKQSPSKRLEEGCGTGCGRGSEAARPGSTWLRWGDWSEVSISRDIWTTAGPRDAAASCPGQRRAQSGMVRGHCPCLTISSFQHHKQAFKHFFVFVRVFDLRIRAFARLTRRGQIAGKGSSLLGERGGSESIPFPLQADLLSGKGFHNGGDKNAA